MSAHKIVDDDGNLTDRETPLRYLKIGDRVTHTEERPNEIATVVRSAGDRVVIRWGEEGLSYGALPEYLRTVTIDPNPATYALDDVMEAFGITREELKTDDVKQVSAEVLWQKVPEWMRDHQLATIPDGHRTKPENQDNYSAAHVASNDIGKADIILSQSENGMHRPILDIDFPVCVIPSSTPGHFHLYLDKQMTFQQYAELLRVLVDVGIIEHGYAGASMARGYTSVRLPWIKKEKDQP